MAAECPITAGLLDGRRCRLEKQLALPDWHWQDIGKYWQTAVMD
jgi:hypothetical protein